MTHDDPTMTGSRLMIPCTTTRRSPAGLLTLLFATLAATCPVGAARGDSSHLHGNVSAGNTTGMQQTITDMPVASLSGLHALDTVGNDATAAGSLAAPSGQITLSTHACSGGGLGFGGPANGHADSDISVSYSIVSSTLPPGTPVQVLVRWSVSAGVKAIGQDLAYINDTAGAGASAQIGVVINSTNVDSTAGSVSRGHATYDGITINQGGSFNPEHATDEVLFTLLVGQSLRLNLQCSVNAGTYASAGTVTTDGDTQLALLWGVTPVDPGAAAVLLGNPAEPAPSAEMATPEHAAEVRPPRPEGPGILPCFRIPTQPVSVAVCAGADLTLSLAVLGTGPFTYRWRKGGVPVDSDLNPSATTNMLSLANVSAASGGSYDCVVTNPCGSITSNSATLTVFAGGSGDGNANGVTDGGDIQGFVNFVLYSGSPGAEYCAYDMNADGMVNPADVPLFVAALLGP